MLFICKHLQIKMIFFIYIIFEALYLVKTNPIFVSSPTGHFLSKTCIIFDTEKCLKMTVSLLICTLIYENQGLETSRSALNLRKISGPANLDFFLGLAPRKKTINLKKIQVTNWKKNPEIFLRFETDLDFSRRWFS